MKRFLVVATATLSLCLLNLLAAADATASFDAPIKWRRCIGSGCFNIAPLFSTKLDVCLDALEPDWTKIYVEATENPIHNFECKGNTVLIFGCFEAQAPDGCYAGFSAGPYPDCPANSTPAAGNQCTCNAGFEQIGSSCSALKNAGEDTGDCTACPISNPVNPANGNKLSKQLVYEGLHNFGLSLTYNGLDDTITRFGRGWRDSFNRRIVVDGTNVYVIHASGRTFKFVQSGGSWISDAEVQDKLVELQDPPGTTSGWALTTADGDRLEIYDAVGNLASISQRSGLTQTLTYSDGTTGPNGDVILNRNGTPSTKPLPAGLLIRATDAFGRTLTFRYNESLRVLRVIDPAGALYRFGYLNRDILTSITYPDNKTKTYVYNESANTSGVSLPWALTGIVDENGTRYSTYKYDAQGRSISTEHAGTTDKYTLTYSAGSTTVVDPRNVSRTYSFQSVLGSLKNTGISGPACPSCGPAARSPDANGNTATSTDWNGNRTNFSYDLARNLQTMRTEALTAAGGSTPETRTVSTQWDTNFRLPTAMAEPLRITTNVYDPDGFLCGARGALCSRTIQATTDVDGSLGLGATITGTPRVWTYTYNANGSLLTLDGPRTAVSDVTSYTYYPNDDPDLGKRGNIATITNAAAHVTNITAYNAHGRPLTIVDPNGLTTTLAYDTRQRLTSRTMGSETTSYEYDGVGQVTKITLPDGSYLTYTYDSAHRMTGMQDSLGNRIAYTLDAMGNRTQEQVFDPGSNLAQTRSRVYNNLNRLFQEVGAASQVTEYAYDAQGNVTSVTDPLTKATSNAYDALNRLRQVTDPALGLTQYAYNGRDALTGVTDPRGQATSYTVDGLGNLTLQQSPDTGNTANSYDPAGNLLTQSDAKGQTTTYAYDALNRVTLITFHDGSKQTYAYDQSTYGLGRLSSITETDPANNVTSVIAYAYDQHGRVTSDTRTLAGQSYVTGYSYDSAGRMDGMTYPSGRTVTYAFDALGRVNQVSTTKPGDPPQVVVQNVSYHPFGGVTGFTFGNGQIYSRTVDQDGRIATYTLGGAPFAIAYDAASRITSISEVANPTNTNNYGYDALDRLTSAALPTTAFGYSYDAVGNRLLKSIAGFTDEYAYSATSNRLASVTPNSGPMRSFSYDANGSTLADGVNTYAYDTRGRMVQATSSVGTTGYQVNALGQRVRKTNASADIVFHYDTRGHLIAETDPGGTSKREYIYLGDMPVGVVQ